jgi:hypothetical protein
VVNFSGSFVKVNDRLPEKEKGLSALVSVLSDKHDAGDKPKRHKRDNKQDGEPSGYRV